MAGEKVTRIHKAKSPFSKDETAGMTDAQAWDWIYANAKPKKEKLSQVCFTGFSVKEKEELPAPKPTSSANPRGILTPRLFPTSETSSARPNQRLYADHTTPSLGYLRPISLTNMDRSCAATILSKVEQAFNARVESPLQNNQAFF